MVKRYKKERLFRTREWKFTNLKATNFAFWTHPFIFDFNMKKSPNFSFKKIIVTGENNFLAWNHPPSGRIWKSKLCPRGFQKYILKIVFLPPTSKDTTGILAVKSGLTLLNSSVFNVKVWNAFIRASCGAVSGGIWKSKLSPEDFKPIPVIEDP